MYIIIFMYIYMHIYMLISICIYICRHCPGLDLSGETTTAHKTMLCLGRSTSLTPALSSRNRLENCKQYDVFEYIFQINII